VGPQDGIGVLREGGETQKEEGLSRTTPFWYLNLKFSLQSVRSKCGLRLPPVVLFSAAT
jgi:hypothetical protein